MVVIEHRSPTPTQKSQVINKSKNGFPGKLKNGISVFRASKNGNSVFRNLKNGNSVFRRCTISLARCTISIPFLRPIVDTIVNVIAMSWPTSQIHCQYGSRNANTLPIRTPKLSFACVFIGFRVCCFTCVACFVFVYGSTF